MSTPMSSADGRVLRQHLPGGGAPQQFIPLSASQPNAAAWQQQHGSSDRHVPIMQLQHLQAEATAAGPHTSGLHTDACDAGGVIPRGVNPTALATGGLNANGMAPTAMHPSGGMSAAGINAAAGGMPNHSAGWGMPSIAAQTTAGPPGGKPLRISRVVEDRDVIEFYAARFPQAVDLFKLSEMGQLRIQREIPEYEEDEESAGGSAFSTSAASLKRATGSTLEFLPWRITTAEHKQFVGRRDGLDTHGYFLQIDRGDHYELVPLNGWFTFASEVSQGANVSSDLMERKRRAALARERQQSAQLEQMTHQRGNDDSDEEDAMGVPRKKVKTDDVLPEASDSLYGDDSLGLKRRERKLFRNVMRHHSSDIKDLDQDDKDYKSALNLGHLKKPSVNWDFEGDGMMSDDEDNLFGSDGDDERHAEKPSLGSDFDDSDEEDQKLTKFGQKMSQLLVSQREKEADDELADISGDEDDDLHEDGAEPKAAADGGGSQAGAGGVEGMAASGQGPAEMSSLQQHVAEKLEMVGGRRSFNVHGTALTPPKSGGTGVADSAGGGSGGAAGGRGGAASGARGPAPMSGSSSGQARTSGGGRGARPQSGPQRDSNSSTEQLRQDLQQSLIRSFNRHSGRMPARLVMEELNINSKGQRFTIVKDLLNSMCSIDSMSKSKMLELKEEYKAS